jgi:hypothetical protein
MASKTKDWKKSATVPKMPKRRAGTEVEVGIDREMIENSEGTGQQTGTLRGGGIPGRGQGIVGSQAQADVGLLLGTGLTPEMMTHIGIEITANIDSGVEMLLART